MRILTFTTKYPNAVKPDFSVFIETRLRKLVALGGMEARVMAPVPWFPSAHPVFGEYANHARVPAGDTRHGISLLHPRFPVIPKVGMTVAPWLLYQATRRHVARLRQNGFDFDLIDAHFFYPEGVAAALLAREFDRPLVITGRGTDINLIPAYRLPRRMIRWAAGRASGMVTVCQALKDSLIELGVEPERVTVLRNGVELDAFRPLPRDAARRALDEAPEGRLIVSVGGLIPRKGHDLVIAALARLPTLRLLIAGEGPEEQALQSLAARLGVAERVRFLGQVPHFRLCEVYSAADAMVLASSREGWANVLLEAMACGTPVCASNIWGTPEVVAEPAAGLLIPERTPEAVAATVSRLLAAPPDRAATRAYAERFSWDDTAHGLAAVFRAAVSPDYLKRRQAPFPLPDGGPTCVRLENTAKPS
jgi:teichuronic acid biosynthesis glycosyltransferase TuaC